MLSNEPEPLAISGSAEVAERLASQHEGADDYLVKPFSADELEWSVEQQIGTAGRGLNGC
jgi:DNA-binding response OmpR family regulator